MTDRELMQEALEAMLSAINAGDWKVDGACDPHATIIRLTNRLAQPEPVHAIDISQERVDETAKHEHEWVGLTDEEFEEYAHWIYPEKLIELENLLKEKNT